MTKSLRDKIRESLFAVLPIALIIMALALTLAPLDAGTFVLFAFGVVLLIFGTGLFTQGADMSLLVIGEKIGTAVVSKKKLWLIALVSLIIGIVVTVAEPDLQILASQVPALASRTPLKNYLLILTVAVGVGVFLAIAMLRIVLHLPLNLLLFAFYAVVFLLSAFVSPSFWAVAFDAGGVTTGPMTVPFILSLGVGVASLRAGRKSSDDSFGLVALSSVGPIIAVLVLAVAFGIGDAPYPVEALPTVSTTYDAVSQYLDGFARYAVEVAVAIIPTFLFFLCFQLSARAFGKKQIARILIGFLYTFAGLVLFLTGAGVGFVPVGRTIGEELTKVLDGWLLIPVGMLLGYFVVAAEPAVHVLNRQVEKISAGAIGARSMRHALCIGVSVALGLAMLRILTGINVIWILAPGYVVALLLTFLTPPVFTGIAFDSGGVASGAMVSSFVLPLAVGACSELAGESAIMTQAFGCVAFVALTPLITIQILGIAYRYRTHRTRRSFLSVEEKIITYEVD